jgi:hypothetical protein
VTYGFMCQARKGVLPEVDQDPTMEHPHATARRDDQEFTEGI